MVPHTKSFSFSDGSNRGKFGPGENWRHIYAGNNYGFRLLESSYAKGINKQLDRTGNLFQQKTKAKFTNEAKDYSPTAFHYIHQNPINAGLVKRPEDWKYSSYLDYARLRNGTLWNNKKHLSYSI